MTKKKTYKVLNDYNDIVNYLEEQRKKRDLEYKILISILGVALGLVITVFFLVKGN